MKLKFRKVSGKKNGELGLGEKRMEYMEGGVGGGMRGDWELEERE